MRLVAIWHGSVSDATLFANSNNVAAALVQLVPDPEMKFSFWGLYKLAPDQWEAVRLTNPRLTWK